MSYMRHEFVQHFFVVLEIMRWLRGREPASLSLIRRSAKRGDPLILVSIFVVIFVGIAVKNLHVLQG